VSKVRFTRHAREDLLDIWLYIAPRRSDTVADQVYDRIEQTCRLLKHNPQLAPARPEIAEDARALVR
jgi:toxin ParE1/3/4